MIEAQARKYDTIAVSSESTVVAEFLSDSAKETAYQSEAQLEQEFIGLLEGQAYEYVQLTSEEHLVTNLRTQLETLNRFTFSDTEWDRFFTERIASTGDGIVEKTVRIQEDHVQLLTRDDGSTKNITLLDKQNIHNNRLQVINQYAIDRSEGGVSFSNRYDVTVLVNGLPMVHIELKRRGVPIREAFNQIDRYQRDSFWAGSGLFEYVQLFVISNGTQTKYYSNTTRRQHVLDMHGSRRTKKTSNSFEFTSWWADAQNKPILDLTAFAKTFFAKHTLLNILTKYCVLTADRDLLVMRPYQIVATERILQKIQISTNYKTLGTLDAGGYVWHTTGSGKTLTSFKTAQLASEMESVDKVIFVVDRKDLDYQTMREYDRFEKGAANSNASTSVLKRQLEDPNARIIITTIHKFAEADGVLNDRDNIIVLVDEAHRTQEGDLGRKMRDALPNAFLFGLTGTPINRADKNTFYAFGADTDEGGYMSRYGLNDSIRDGATKELHFEPRLVDLHIDQKAIEEAYAELTQGLTDEDRDRLGKAAAKMSILVKSPKRIAAICADIAKHFQEKVAPNGFGAQVVTFDRESCLLYKQELDRHLPPEVSDVVISVNSGEPEYAAFKRDRDAEEKLLDRFRDPKDPLKIIIVTSKLLTGFDAPILQTMYLDKPLRDHTLLQAICRTNRPYGEQKTHGLIVDYLGIFDDVAQALKFDEEGVQKAVSNIAELINALPTALQKCLAYFAGVDRSLTGYEGLIAAQECIPNNDLRDAFAADFSVLARTWEALSPDPVLTQYETDYRWLAQVYESLKPSSGTGRLLWHRLGAKTIELIHENVHVDAVRDDLDTLVLDAELLEAVLGNPDPEKKAKEISVKLAGRLRKHAGNPKFKALGERLEDLRNRHQQGLLLSIDFLKELLALAKDVVKTERETPEEEDIDRGKAALTELFEEARNGDTPVMVKRVVDDIDEIVRAVRFDGWQATHAGEREVKKALRQTLFRYKLHQDAELFEKAYGYIREYY